MTSLADTARVATRSAAMVPTTPPTRSVGRRRWRSRPPVPRRRHWPRPVRAAARSETTTPRSGPTGGGGWPWRARTCRCGRSCHSCSSWRSASPCSSVRSCSRRSSFRPASMEQTLLVGDRVLVNKIVYDVRPARAGRGRRLQGHRQLGPGELRGAGWRSVGRHRPYPGRPCGCEPAGREGLHQAGDRRARRPGFVLRRRRPGLCERPGHRRAVRHDELAARGSARRPGVPVPALRGGSRARPVSCSSWVITASCRRIPAARARCPIENVIGRAFVIVWPSGRWDTLSVPETFQNVPGPVALGPSGQSARRTSRSVPRRRFGWGGYRPARSGFFGGIWRVLDGSHYGDDVRFAGDRRAGLEGTE